MTAAYDVLRMLRCATAREVAERLGVAYGTARTYLRRLVDRGVAEKKVVGRSVVYCIAADATRGYKLYPETRRRLSHVEELLRRVGCVSVSALMQELRISHSHAYHLLNVMLVLRRGVKVALGRVAVLCRDREAAEEAVHRLREVVHKLVVENKARYVTASKALRLVAGDRDAYALFRRFIPSLRLGATRFPAVALAFMNAVLRSLYGEPMLRQRRQLIYATTQPRPEHGIEIVDSLDKYTLYVSLPDDLATALRGADVNEVVIQAVEQLLARYRP